MRIFVLALLILTACDFPKLPKSKKPKELSSITKNEIEQIKKELKIENLQYGFYTKKINGNKTMINFDITLSDIDDSVDFKPYNKRLIEAFNASGFDFKKCNKIDFYYFRKYSTANLYVYYAVNPIDYSIMEEAKD
jgi:hypothetical protein